MTEQLPSDERTMDTETLTALRGSIAKWEAIVAGKGVDLGADNCPLCRRFNDYVNPNAGRFCAGCPVALEAGLPRCEGTPYDRYQAAEEAMCDNEDEAGYHENAMAAAAKDELAFLKSLLPENSNV